ncbi:MAG TPA: 3-deoxy-D-manno-octulosonic acid transferase [Acetobacteraceae bacterium]|nr:3-deoxy-D-manno-octulosonic acid transferase [Acetobacteraceae bacterium]
MSALVRIWAGAMTLAAPGLRLMLRVRLSRGKEAPGRLPERHGIDRTPRPPGRLLWLHAASVGETTSVLPVLALLLEKAPDLTVLFSTCTVTSARLLGQRLTPEQSARVLHRFVPLDVPAWAARFLDHWRPDAGAFLESELWPNLLTACRARNIPLMLLNARLSPRSFDRWRRLPGLAGELLGGFALVHARSEADAARLRALGARRVEAPGDLKFAAPPLPSDPDEQARIRSLVKDRPTWLAASTHPGEEALVFAVHRALVERYPDVLTVLAPRHPERGTAIAAEAAPLPVTRRGLGEGPPAGPGIWLADTLGELGLWYRLAPVAFVGRSLIAPGGGQNPLEPARLGCAVVVGPHTGNFEAHVALLREAEALTVVRDAGELAGFVADMLAAPAVSRAMGARAEAALQRQGHLVEETAEAVLTFLTAPACSERDRLGREASQPQRRG